MVIKTHTSRIGTPPTTTPHATARHISTLYITTIITCLISGLLLYSNASAATCAGVETSLFECSEGGDGGVYFVLKLILDIITTGVGILAVTGIIWAGIQYLTAADSTEKTTKAKRRLYEIVIGLTCYAILWGIAQWLLPGGLLNLDKDNTGVSSVTISYTGPATVGKSFIPTVNFNGDAKDTTYSLVSSDSGVIDTLGQIAKCTNAGTATIEVIAANGLRSSTSVQCEETPSDSKSSTPSSSSNGTETTGSTENTKLTGDPKIRPETRAIINAHNKDFFYSGSKSYEKVVLSKNSQYGSYSKYVDSLGGVFKDFVNTPRIKVTTAADFQLAAEYVFGLMMIWGPDYSAGNYHSPEKWRGDDAFYEGSSRGSRGYAKTASVNTVLSKSAKQSIDTNCNKSIDIFIKTTNLAFPKGGTSTPHYGMSKYPKNGGKITNIKDLRVGDVVNLYTSNGGHVAVVGEVYQNKIVMYDGGPFFQRSKKYKFAIDRTDSRKMNGKYKIYGSWYGWRPWNIDQNTTLKGIN